MFTFGKTTGRPVLKDTVVVMSRWVPRRFLNSHMHLAVNTQTGGHVNGFELREKRTICSMHIDEKGARHLLSDLKNGITVSIEHTRQEEETHAQVPYVELWFARVNHYPGLW